MSFEIGDDIIDTRDLEDRITELEALESNLEEALEALAEAEAEDKQEANEAVEEARIDFSPEERAELNKLRAFRSEIDGYCDYHHGETLVHEDYREEYAEQLADDIGAIRRDARWPLNHIDWKSAADELFSNDYHYAEIQGHTYYVRMS